MKKIAILLAATMAFAIRLVTYKLRGIAISISNIRSAAEVVRMVEIDVLFLNILGVGVPVASTFVFWI